MKSVCLFGNILLNSGSGVQQLIHSGAAIPIIVFQIHSPHVGDVFESLLDDPS